MFSVAWLLCNYWVFYCFFLANPRSCLESYRLAQIKRCKASNLVISGVCFFVSISTDQELGTGYSEHGTCKDCKRIVPKPYSYLKSVQESPEWVTPNSLWMSCGFAKPWIFKYHFKHLNFCANVLSNHWKWLIFVTEKPRTLWNTCTVNDELHVSMYLARKLNH